MSPNDIEEVARPVSPHKNEAYIKTQTSPSAETFVIAFFTTGWWSTGDTTNKYRRYNTGTYTCAQNWMRQQKTVDSAPSAWVTIFPRLCVIISRSDSEGLPLNLRTQEEHDWYEEPSVFVATNRRSLELDATRLISNPSSISRERLPVYYHINAWRYILFIFCLAMFLEKNYRYW